MFFGFASDLSYDYTEYKPQGFFLVLRCFQSLRLFIAILDMKPDRNRIYHMGCHASAPDLIGICSVSPPLFASLQSRRAVADLGLDSVPAALCIVTFEECGKNSGIEGFVCPIFGIGY
jgi:hypothetical protein